MKNELTNILDIFQQGYVERDLAKIESFMTTLFDKNEEVIVLGRSNGEWCLGYDEVKDLFLSDWEYWGDLSIKSEEASIVDMGNSALIYVPGTVKYTFYSDSKTYARYLGYIKDYFEEGSSNSKKADKVKLTEINRTLCHLLSQRDSNERCYLWDISVSFVLIKKENRWIIKQMQFSIPAVGHLPDVRIDNVNYTDETFNNDIKKVKDYSANNKSQFNDEIVKFLKEFNKSYLDKAVDIEAILTKYFSNNKLIIANTDKRLYVCQEEARELLKSHRDYYDEININYENSIINSNEDVVWIVTQGILKKTMDERKAFENTLNNINTIFSKNQKDREKLFNIRRRIADTLKETVKGENYVWPFRFEGVLIKNNDGWVFKYLQFSLPFNYILEGKTEAATLLEENI